MNTNKQKIQFIFCLMIGILFISLLGIFCHIENTVFASTSNKNSVKVIQSIEIKENDTLWNIAQKYYTEEYTDISSFIQEIKNSNGIKSDNIHVGAYLIVPHYKSQLAQTE